MKAIQVQVLFNAPIARVFEAVSDHERFFTGGGITGCRVIRSGERDKNGRGCLREIEARGVRYMEEITTFERPDRLAYQNSNGCWSRPGTGSGRRVPE